MEIKGKVYLFFEQSGTFKNEFKKLGYEAVDLDIQNNFGETDHVVDLFKQIEDAYEGKPSIFDNIRKDDLIIAFFPCIKFCDMSTLNIRVTDGTKNRKRAYELAIKLHNERNYFFALLHKMLCVIECRELRCILENPYNGQTYLKEIMRKPDVVDKNRMLRGDYFIKPTAYWFYNCKPTYQISYQNDKEQKIIWKKNSKVKEMGEKRGLSFASGSSKSGLCSEERSMISPDYARNFICDFILGKEQKHTQLTFF